MPVEGGKETPNTTFLKALIRPSDEGFKTLAKDPSLQLNIAQYQHDLAQFLSQPDILDEGQQIFQAQDQLDQLKGSHQQQLAAFSDSISGLSKEHTNLTNSRGQQRRRIAMVGKEPIMEGDKELMVGRLQVAIWEARGENRLSWQGSLAGWVLGRFGIHPQKVHPAIAQIDAQRLSLQDQIGDLQRQREEKIGQSGVFIEEEARARAKIARMKEGLLQTVDDWAVYSWDRCLIHACLSDERRFDLLRKFKNTNPADYPTLLDGLRFFGLLPVVESQDAAVSPTAVAQELIQPDEIRIPNEIPRPLLLHKKGREIMVTQKDQVQPALIEVLGSLKDEQRFDKLLIDLLALAMAENPLDLPFVKKLTGGRRVYQGVGGEFVYANKDRRIVFSMIERDNRPVIDVGRVSYRNEGTYGRWD